MFGEEMSEDAKLVVCVQDRRKKQLHSWLRLAIPESES
jgi:hypothetical protein